MRLSCRGQRSSSHMRHFSSLITSHHSAERQPHPQPQPRQPQKATQPQPSAPNPANSPQPSPVPSPAQASPAQPGPSPSPAQASANLPFMYQGGTCKTNSRAPAAPPFGRMVDLVLAVDQPYTTCEGPKNMVPVEKLFGGRPTFPFICKR